VKLPGSTQIPLEKFVLGKLRDEMCSECTSSALWENAQKINTKIDIEKRIPYLGQTFLKNHFWRNIIHTILSEALIQHK
jgi:hypothetical protein